MNTINAFATYRARHIFLTVTITILVSGAINAARAEPFAYVTKTNLIGSGLESSVATVDTATNAILTSTKLPLLNNGQDSNPGVAGLALTLDGKRAYVAGNHFDCVPFGNCTPARMHVFDTATRTFIGTPFKLRGSLNPVAWVIASPDGKSIYVTDAGDCYSARNVWVINPVTNATDGEPIRLPSGQLCNSDIGQPAITPDGKFILVPTRDGLFVGDTVTRTLAGEAVFRILRQTYFTLPNVVSNAAVSTDGKLVYVITLIPETGEIALRFVDLITRNVVASIPLSEASTIALSPDGKLIYLAAPTAVKVIDAATRTQVGSPILLPVGINSYVPRAATTSDGKRLYLLVPKVDASGNLLPAALIGIDTATRIVLPELPVGYSAYDVAIAKSIPVVTGGFPRTAILDNFNRANGVVGSAWSGNTPAAGYQILAQQVDVNQGGRIYWKTPSFGVNQEVFFKLLNIDTDSISQGLILKAQSATPAATPLPTDGRIEVLYNAAARNVRVQTIRTGGPIPTVTYTVLPQQFVNGDQLGARVGSNGVVSVFRNGTLIGNVTLNAADKTFFNGKGGRIGIRFNGSSSEALFDDFGGGTVP